MWWWWLQWCRWVSTSEHHAGLQSGWNLPWYLWGEQDEIVRSFAFLFAFVSPVSQFGSQWGHTVSSYWKMKTLWIINTCHLKNVMNNSRSGKTVRTALMNYHLKSWYGKLSWQLLINGYEQYYPLSPRNVSSSNHFAFGSVLVCFWGKSLTLLALHLSGTHPWQMESISPPAGWRSWWCQPRRSGWSWLWDCLDPHLL